MTRRNAFTEALTGAFDDGEVAHEYPTADSFGPAPRLEAYLDEAVPRDEDLVADTDWPASSPVLPRTMRTVVATP